MWANVEEFCGPVFSIKFEKQEYLGGKQEEIWLIRQKKWSELGMTFSKVMLLLEISLFLTWREEVKTESMMGFDLHIKGHSELVER